MTYEEAIEKIKIMWAILGNENNDVTEAFSIAIDALEKQIPIKPNKYYPFYCPRCNTKLDPTRFCGSCGQRIVHEWVINDDLGDNKAL